MNGRSCQSSGPCQTIRLSVVGICCILFSRASAECVMNITSYELYKKLVDSSAYNKRTHPSLTGPTIILLGIYINGFNYISEQSMDYEINLYMREQWWDPRLAFNRSHMCGMEFMKLPDRAWDKIWVPDVFFRNEKKATFHEVTLPNRLMRLYPNGTVYYAAKITATLSCQMKLHKYPLDTQVCPIQFESFGHTVKANVYQWRPGPVEKDEQLILPQFELHATNTKNCQQTYATGDYPCLEVEFVLRRNIGYYLIQLYVPSVLIVILSWVAFWISIDAIPARVTIGLLTVLTMTTQSATARASLPRVSYIKAMDVWMSICLLFVFASLLEFAVVNVFSRKEIRKKSQGLSILSETAKDFEDLICAQVSPMRFYLSNISVLIPEVIM
uniref:Glycine receptor subunit alpha-2 n=1 Tax=Macrostomum lignano TaxID=282301 RepID=A0A1I8H093_9PLAT